MTPLVLYSTEQGHRWVRSALRPTVARCIDCHDTWPISGDLAPMPRCPGERDIAGELAAANRKLERLRGRFHTMQRIIDEILREPDVEKAGGG